MNSEERTSRIVQTPACSILQHPADIPAAPSQRRVSFPLVGIRYVSRKCLGSAVFPWPSEHNNVRTCLRLNSGVPCADVNSSMIALPWDPMRK
ncbi:hypothetical protein PAXINDRAFT_173491 [Paxillus involutus ATCC 200175]|uniref:Uncharacterized protein n=1 Tax=Paxillus involutus ATCC 200175 TaxID=664439 RepID=A0A0C9TJB2_PAXIN|nr:hypothetical protein PAXINDRAFT_173491 [Paxillus involutus ATCC 200175]